MNGNHPRNHFIHRLGTARGTTTKNPRHHRPEPPTRPPGTTKAGQGGRWVPLKGDHPPPHPHKPSHTLTTPQHLQYSPTMATWSTEQRTHALDLLRNGNTLAHTHHTTSIPKTNLRRWAANEGIEVVRATEKTQHATEANRVAWEARRAIVAEKAGRLAELAADEATRLLSEGEYLEAQRLMTVMGVAVDKAQLLTGQATAITEHQSPDRTPDQEHELAKVLDLVRSA